MTIDPKDDELMLRIKRRDADPALADEAFLILYDRHYQLLYQTVENANHQLVGFGVDAADIVEKAFQKLFYKAAPQFKRGTYDKPDGSFFHIQGLLQTIANREIIDALRSPDHVVPIAPTAENDAIFGFSPEKDDKDGEVNGQASYEALHLLVAETLNNKRDQAIVWFKIRYRDETTGASEPPAEELERFCKKWDVKPNTLCKAYERALKKLSLAASGRRKQLQPSSTEPGDSNAYTE